MDKLIIKVPGAPEREMELPPGTHKVGRNLTADLQIPHPSVSGSHCELQVAEGGIFVKDLNSTNGTHVDGQRVGECQISPGQSLRLGEVEIVYAPRETASAGLKLAAHTEIPPPIPPAVDPYIVRLVPPRKARVTKNFYQGIPGAFAYPFKKNGIYLLVGGTVVFGLFDFVVNLRAFGMLLVGGAVGFICGAMVSGYIFLYMQSIITSSAMGDHDIPNWPEYDGWWDSAIGPYLRMLAIGIVCFLPAQLCLRLAGENGALMSIPFVILGGLYAPMALLAVAIDDSLAGLNPMLVLPSIFRVIGAYLVTCLLVGLMLLVFGLVLGAIVYLSTAMAAPPPPGSRPILLPGPPPQQQFLTQIVGAFLTLYFGVVATRLLGLLYYTHKERLGWQR